MLWFSGFGAWRIPFAVLVSSAPILILINGAFGSTGSPVLTAAVLGGAALVLMIVFALRRLWTVARIDREGAFVFSGLVFVLVNDLAYGSLVSTGLLFLFLGYAARLTEQSSPAHEMALRKFRVELR